MIGLGRAYVFHTCRTSEHRDGSHSGPYWSKKKKHKKTGSYWTTEQMAHWLHTGFSCARRIHWKLQEQRIPPVGSVRKLDRSSHWTRVSCRGQERRIKNKKEKKHLKTKCTFFYVGEQTGICKYYVCRFVWVTRWIFSLWQQVQVKMTYVILALMLYVSIIHYFLNPKANWCDLKTQKWMLTV